MPRFEFANDLIERQGSALCGKMEQIVGWGELEELVPSDMRVRLTEIDVAYMAGGEPIDGIFVRDGEIACLPRLGRVTVELPVVEGATYGELIGRWEGLEVRGFPDDPPDPSQQGNEEVRVRWPLEVSKEGDTKIWKPLLVEAKDFPYVTFTCEVEIRQ